MSWRSVTKSKPCAVCGKPDWCTRGDRAACCMRVESARKLRNGGWLHGAGSSGPVVDRPVPVSVARWADAGSMAETFRRQLTIPLLSAISRELGVSAASLLLLDIGWSCRDEAYTFPMRDGAGRVIGIRTRTLNGQKKTISGTRSGLVMPHTKPTGIVLICEGPTDTAAMLTLGFYAIGRPSCIGSESIVSDWLKHHKIERAIIIPDSDTPGVSGAGELARMLNLDILVPPTKDARAWLNAGLTRETLVAEFRHRGLLPTVSPQPVHVDTKDAGLNRADRDVYGSCHKVDPLAGALTTPAHLHQGSGDRNPHNSRLCAPSSANPYILVPSKSQLVDAAVTSVYSDKSSVNVTS